MVVVGRAHHGDNEVTVAYVASAALCLVIIFAACGPNHRAATPLIGHGKSSLSRHSRATQEVVRDSTAALQRTLDRVAPGTAVRIPPGTYHCGHLVLANRTDIEVDGSGVTIVWHGTAQPGSRVGLELQGMLARVRIHGFRMVGDGTTTSRHAGIFNRSGSDLKDIEIQDNDIEGVTLGISANADLGGHLKRIRIVNNRIRRVVGTEPGWGYGIHVASHQSDPLDVEVSGNTIVNAERHGIYQARGRGSLIADNVVLDHRATVATGGVRPAIIVARAADVRVHGNVVRGHADGGIMVTTGASGTAGVLLRGNRLTDARNAVPSIIVGSQKPATEGVPKDIVIEGNTVIVGAGRGEPLRVYAAEGLRIVGNVFTAGRAFPRSPAIALRCDCAPIFTNNTVDGEIRNMFPGAIVLPKL